MSEWPVHTICKTKDFEAYYKSCDPLQDIGFSFNPCSRILPRHQIITVGVLLRRDIKSLYLTLTIFYNGVPLIHQEKTLCGDRAPRFSFCGKKKGEFIFYDHTIRLGFPAFPKGDYIVLLELRNEDNYKIVCGNITLYSHPQLDYY
ncbi:lymphocyte antigen 86 isoform X2 [Mixophyes fleayi]